MNATISPSLSSNKQRTKSGEVPETPQSGESKATSKYAGSSNPSTISSLNKITPNNDNVRARLAEQGMWFEIQERFALYPHFQNEILEMVTGDRASALKAESAKAIKSYMAENATKDEKTFFGRLIPMIIKTARGEKPTKKRDAGGEIMLQAKTFFEQDGLDYKRDCQFLEGGLPRRVAATGITLGLTEPKPDWVYGFRIPRYPDITLPIVSDAVKALIEVAPGLRHIWFIVENKGSQDSIESCETQAIRSGAVPVSTQRQLAVLAGELDLETEPVGADTEHIAFSCSYVPQTAKLHVHWHEKLANGESIYHMSLIRGYLMIDDKHLSDFCKDVHNILDYGLAPSRIDKLRQQYIAIAKREGSLPTSSPESTTTEAIMSED